MEKIKSSHLIESLVSANQFSVISIKDNENTEMRDWVRFRSREIGHALVVMGYGKEVSPYSYKEEKYSLVRNSLTKTGLHQKVSKENL